MCGIRFERVPERNSKSFEWGKRNCEKVYDDTKYVELGYTMRAQPAIYFIFK